jgi:hypothetical protein
MLVESLDVLQVLHFILVVEGKEGPGVGIGDIPEFKGRPTPTREHLL